MKRSAGKRTTGNRRAAQLAAAALAAGAVLGIGSTTAPPVAGAKAIAPPRSEASVALHAVNENDAQRALWQIPAGFVRQFGYRPAMIEGVLVDPHGDCSSPIPLPREFDTACMAHDLGYDLLRFGSTTDDPSLLQGRRDLDAQLGRAMHDSCDDRSGFVSRTTCHGAAEVASSAVEFNSWRQHYGAPAPEPALPFLLVVSVVAAGLTVATASARVRAATP